MGILIVLENWRSDLGWANDTARILAMLRESGIAFPRASLGVAGGSGERSLTAEAFEASIAGVTKPWGATLFDPQQRVEGPAWLYWEGGLHLKMHRRHRGLYLRLTEDWDLSVGGPAAGLLRRLAERLGGGLGYALQTRDPVAATNYALDLRVVGGAQDLAALLQDAPDWSLYVAEQAAPSPRNLFPLNVWPADYGSRWFEGAPGLSVIAAGDRFVVAQVEPALLRRAREHLREELFTNDDVRL